MLWICIGFNADPDPDPAFYLYAIRIQEAKLTRISAEPDQDPGQTFKHKVYFLHEKYS